MKKLSFEEFNVIFNKVPRLCVEIVIIQNNKILLTLRKINPAKGKWHLPGGTMQFDESVVDCVHRIAKEELGVKIEILKFLGYCDWKIHKNAFGHSVSLVFKTRIIDGEIKTDFQASEVNFFDKLPESLLDESRKFIEENLDIH